METEELLVHEQTDAANGPQSPIAALRAKRQEIAERTTTLIPVTGYEEDNIHCKYRLIGRDEADQIAKSVRGQTKDRQEFQYRVLVDTMIAACEGFFIKPLGVDDGQANPLLNEAETEQIDTYYAFALELGAQPEEMSQRRAVKYVFGDNEFAVGGHALLLNRWLGNTGLKIDEELLEG